MLWTYIYIYVIRVGGHTSNRVGDLHVSISNIGETRGKGWEDSGADILAQDCFPQLSRCEPCSTSVL